RGDVRAAALRLGSMAGALTVGLDKRYRSGAVVSARFDAVMRGGAIAVLFGPSGAGKTTVVRSIAGLERPDRGRIVCAGETWFDGTRVWLPPQRRAVGSVGQQPALFPHLTVRANIAYGLRDRSNAVRDERSDEMLALLDLTALAGRSPDELSGGEAQRVA